jgi:transcriptional regulator of aromatic amino acid metabolism
MDRMLAAASCHSLSVRAVVTWPLVHCAFFPASLHFIELVGGRSRFIIDEWRRGRQL